MGLQQQLVLLVQVLEVPIVLVQVVQVAPMVEVAVPPVEEVVLDPPSFFNSKV